VVTVSKPVAQLPDALRDGGLGHRNVGPYGVEQFLLGHQPAGVLREAAQHLEGFGPQREFLVARAQASSRQVEGEPVKLENPLENLPHSAIATE
jgi:hypothetical protein